MPGTQKHKHGELDKDLCLFANKIQYTHKSRYQLTVWQYQGVRDILATSHWCKKADLMTAGVGKAERRGP